MITMQLTNYKPQSSFETQQLKQRLLNDETIEETVNNFMRELKKHSEDVSRATGNNTFDLDRLQQLIFLLLDSERDMRPAITCFVRYLRYCDVQYFTIRVLHKAIRELKQQNLEESISKHLSINAASLISSIRLPNLKSADASEQLTRLKYLCETSGFRFKYDMVAKMFTSTCTTFLSFGNDFEAIKKMLAMMDTHILPHYKNPLSLADFLINSYNLGGSVALLSLSSLFLLMTQYNLDYPDFFVNFYRLVSPEILYVKYRSRFLYWTDIFLSSTNLPAYLAASFIKKLSRLALIAPVDALLPLIPLISNILIRHPNLHHMISREDLGASEMSSDPFDFEQPDPKQSQALQSSLWELKSLQNHWHSKVRDAAKFINKPLPKDEIDLSDLLESTFADLLEHALCEKSLEKEIEITPEMRSNVLSCF